MKIAHLTSAHPRYDTRVFKKECCSLAEVGYKVFLVVADGKGFELNTNIEIIDVGYYASRFKRMVYATYEIYKVALQLDAKIYHFHDPELLLVGLMLKKNGKKVIFDMHENTDLQIMSKLWIPKFLRRSIAFLYHYLEIYVIKKLDAVIVPQNEMKNRFSKYNRIEVVANYPSRTVADDFKNVKNKYGLIYAGSITEARGVFNMLDLICSLSKINEKYILTLAGSVDSKLLAKLKNHPGWSNVKFLGLISEDSLYLEYAKNSIGLILFNNVGQYYMSNALKLFEYMQNGMFVIMPNFGNWLDFNMENKAGLCLDPLDFERNSQIINGLTNFELMVHGRSNFELMSSRFMWSNELIKMDIVYKELLG